MRMRQRNGALHRAHFRRAIWISALGLSGSLLLFALFFPVVAAGQGINDILRIIIPPATHQQPPAPVYRPPRVYAPGEYSPPRSQPQHPVQRQPYIPPAPQISRDEVKHVQQMLNDLGFDAGPADGIAGRRTISALNDFRRENGMAVSDTVDTRSIHALTAVHNRNDVPSQPSTGTYGSEDNSVAPPTEEGDQPDAQSRAEPPLGSVARQASFDCDLATSDAEKTICDDITLSTLDGQLSRLYYQQLQGRSNDAAERIKNDQRAWLSERDQCGGDQPCLLTAYAKRIDALEDTTSFIQASTSSSEAQEHTEPARRSARTGVAPARTAAADIRIP